MDLRKFIVLSVFINSIKTEVQTEFLLTLNIFQLLGRYPEYLTQMHRVCNERFTTDMINSVYEFRIWLQEKLQ
jgi:hypothetical protein